MMKKHHMMGIILTLVIIIAGIFFIASKRAEAPNIADATKDWITYKNGTYQFELRHPPDWQVAENTSIPVINIYKSTQTTKPPYTIHNNATAVAIFPDGLGTEGPMGASRQTTQTFAGKKVSTTEYLLDDNSVWARFFATGSAIKLAHWSEYSFIWAGLEIQNPKIACMENGKEVSSQNCDFGAERTGDIVRTGALNLQDKNIEDQIIASFKFTK